MYEPKIPVGSCIDIAFAGYLALKSLTHENNFIYMYQYQQIIRWVLFFSILSIVIFKFILRWQQLQNVPVVRLVNYIDRWQRQNLFWVIPIFLITLLQFSTPVYFQYRYVIIPLLWVSLSIKEFWQYLGRLDGHLSRKQRALLTLRLFLNSQANFTLLQFSFAIYTTIIIPQRSYYMLTACHLGMALAKTTAIFLQMMLRSDWVIDPRHDIQLRRRQQQPTDNENHIRKVITQAIFLLAVVLSQMIFIVNSAMMEKSWSPFRVIQYGGILIDIVYRLNLCSYSWSRIFNGDQRGYEFGYNEHEDEDYEYEDQKHKDYEHEDHEHGDHEHEDAVMESEKPFGLQVIVHEFVNLLRSRKVYEIKGCFSCEQEEFINNLNAEQIDKCPLKPFQNQCGN